MLGGGSIFSNPTPNYQQLLAAMMAGGGAGTGGPIFGSLAPHSIGGPQMPAPRQGPVGGPMPAANMQGPQPTQASPLATLGTYAQLMAAMKNNNQSGSIAPSALPNSTSDFGAVSAQDLLKGSQQPNWLQRLFNAFGPTGNGS